jgi:hypothetical protein
LHPLGNRPVSAADSPPCHATPVPPRSWRVLRGAVRSVVCLFVWVMCLDSVVVVRCAVSVESTSGKPALHGGHQTAINQACSAILHIVATSPETVARLL